MLAPSSCSRGGLLPKGMLFAQAVVSKTVLLKGLAVPSAANTGETVPWIEWMGGEAGVLGDACSCRLPLLQTRYISSESTTVIYRTALVTS